MTIAEGQHPFPFRTRQLSPPAPMVLLGRLSGRVGHRREYVSSLGVLASRLSAARCQIEGLPAGRRTGREQPTGASGGAQRRRTTHSPVAQRQSDWLLTSGLVVRIRPGEPVNPQIRTSGESQQCGSEARWRADLSAVAARKFGIPVRPSSPSPNLEAGLARSSVRACRPNRRGTAASAGLAACSGPCRRGVHRSH